VACDHYRRYREDVALLGDLGLNAYRFSVSWGRVLPEGRGRINPAGLGFYERLVDAVLERGIQPMVTLYHWDLPAALDRLGGWLNPDSADWFADYAQRLFRTLGDRVKLWVTLNEPWVTLNEPWVVVDGGYLHGVLAPGQRNPFAAPLAAHNLLRAHGSAVQAYRAEGRHQIGLVVNLEPKYPAAETAEDLNATMRADAYWNRQYLDPVFLGGYPPELSDIFGEAWPAFPDADFDLIRQPLDFIGVNYYSRQVVRHDPADWPLAAARVRQPRQTHTGLEWEVYPRGLTDILEWVAGRYGPLPLYVTENGAAFYDPPQTEGKIDDPLRRRYLRDHLCAVLEARRKGVDLRGYFAWSLLTRLLCLVAVGQFRMGLRLLATFWVGACGLRDAAAHAQGQRPILCGGDPKSRRGVKVGSFRFGVKVGSFRLTRRRASVASAANGTPLAGRVGQNDAKTESLRIDRG